MAGTSLGSTVLDYQSCRNLVFIWLENLKSPLYRVGRRNVSSVFLSKIFYGCEHESKTSHLNESGYHGFAFLFAEVYPPNATGNYSVPSKLRFIALEITRNTSIEKWTNNNNSAPFHFARLRLRPITLSFYEFLWIFAEIFRSHFPPRSRCLSLIRTSVFESRVCHGLSICSLQPSCPSDPWQYKIFVLGETNRCARKRSSRRL